MILDRLHTLMSRLTDNTVLADLLAPANRALEQVREAAAMGRSLSMSDFVALGVLRHLQGTTTLREQVQALLHLEPSGQQALPLARSTWSDALCSAKRLGILQAMLPHLLTQAATVLPDRLAGLPGLGKRPVLACDGSYQSESAHFRRQTPQEGGQDNPKGHALLSFFNLRLGLPVDVQVDTRSRHETRLLRDYDAREHALTRWRKALWLLDRAFIDASFWDAKKRTLGATMITRWKSSLVIDSSQGRPISDDPLNEGVISDCEVRLPSSPEPWRKVVFKTRRGRTVTFLSNDFDLQPGLIAFLYSRRWDEEKCFDTWKNDFAQAKAWGKRSLAIENQTVLAIITSILVAMALPTMLDDDDPQDTKALRKADKRQAKAPEHPDSTDRPDWANALFRHTSKISRQVLRFFKHCFLEPASPELYQARLRPLLAGYL
jgi:hypothetical protein